MADPSRSDAEPVPYAGWCDADAWVARASRPAGFGILPERTSFRVGCISAWWLVEKFVTGVSDNSQQSAAGNTGKTYA